jgi:hypothetical protein
VNSVVEGSKIPQTVQNQFIDFSYTNPNDLGVSPDGVTMSYYGERRVWLFTPAVAPSTGSGGRRAVVVRLAVLV